MQKTRTDLRYQVHTETHLTQEPPEQRHGHRVSYSAPISSSGSHHNLCIPETLIYHSTTRATSFPREFSGQFCDACCSTSQSTPSTTESIVYKMRPAMVPPSRAYSKRSHSLSLRAHLRLTRVPRAPSSLERASSTGRSPNKPHHADRGRHRLE